jgi:AcrR family transcriptional regulator
VSLSIIMKSTRPYVMTARAEAVAQTRERILRAAIGLADRGPLAAISLAAVAANADVSVQTVLRQFGSRDGLIDAAVELAHQQIVTERTVPDDDVTAAVSALVDSYESGGDGSILMLGQESTDPRAARITARGRTFHREWVEDVFTPQLGEAAGPEREEMIDMLVVATDVYTWKLLRRDRGLRRDVVKSRMVKLVEAVVGGGDHG